MMAGSQHDPRAILHVPHANGARWICGTQSLRVNFSFQARSDLTMPLSLNRHVAMLT
jgi:hypothetical protein